MDPKSHLLGRGKASYNYLDNRFYLELGKLIFEGAPEQRCPTINFCNYLGRDNSKRSLPQEKVGRYRELICEKYFNSCKHQQTKLIG